MKLMPESWLCLPRICSLADDLPGHKKTVDRMEDGKRDRLWAVRAPKQEEVTYKQRQQGGLLEGGGIWVMA